jgi:tetratricopeptide (TPR) repeat protein
MIALFIATSCNTVTKEQQIENINKLEKEVYGSQSLDREKGISIIDAYVKFSEENPEDTTSASYLFKAAELSMNLQLGSQAILYYDKIMNNYPEFNKVEECLFLKAFVYENQLQDMDNAKKYYTQFIEEYPNHILVKDAEASIKYLGKSPEELVKMFQEQNEEKE